MECAGKPAHSKMEPQSKMLLKPLQFRNVTIDFPVVLAPMAGYTDAAFRSVCKEHGAGACWTEVTSAEGIRRDSQKTFQFLKVSELDHPIAGHIFGKSVEAMVEAAQYIEKLGCFDWIDLNCGCPVRKAVRRGAGAALMKEPEQIGEIVRAVKAAVALPVSVKTRIGFSPAFPDHLAIAKIVEDAGADMISVHARYACDFHKGDADWEKLREIKQTLNIPVIGNGGLDTPEDAPAMLKATGVDGVMIGRGAVGNPWIFEQCRAALAGEPAAVPTLAERREVIETHLLHLVEMTASTAVGRRRKAQYDPEQGACMHFRPHLAQYLKGLRGRRELLQQLNEMKTVETIMAAVDKVLEKNMECGGLPPLSCAELAPRVAEASLGKQSAGKSAQSKTIKPPQSIEYGIQPLEKIMEEHGLKNHDLVAASKEGLTHKQVQKGRKGRRLTRNIQDKIAKALSLSTGETYTPSRLFDYN